MFVANRGKRVKPSPVLIELVQPADLVFATVDEAGMMTDGVTGCDLASGLAALGPEKAT